MTLTAVLWPITSLPAAEPSFQADIRPIVQARCVKCHGADEKSGDVNFAAIADDQTAARQRKLWRKGVAQLEAGTMPPKDAPQLTAEEKQRLLAWMKRTIDVVNCDDPAQRDPGPTVIRRLSLSEYNRTIRDLLGFEFDAAATVGMTDDAGEGNSFGNLAAALEMPPALLEKYFAAADQILDRFFGTELSSSVDGRIQEQARNSREQMFLLKPGDWRKADYEVAPPQSVEPRGAGRAGSRRQRRRSAGSCCRGCWRCRGCCRTACRLSHACFSGENTNGASVDIRQLLTEKSQQRLPRQNLRRGFSECWSAPNMNTKLSVHRQTFQCRSHLQPNA